MSKKKKSLISYSHTKDKRMNLPTDQTERFMSDEDLRLVSYSPTRRAAEGPRLSWRRGHSVDDMGTKAGPLFIHEKVSPTAFAKQLTDNTDPSSLFGEFNGLPARAAFSCYQHEGNWSNRIIKGHSERVMASLAAKEGLAGQVQMVYWDPPYGISFNSNFQPSTRKRAGGPPTDSASTLAFRDTYRDGIHSYLDSVYRIAANGRALLTDSGSFFLQISSANVHRVALVLDEVFGPENRVATIAFAKTGASSAKNLGEICDYILWFAKDIGKVKFHQLFEQLTRVEKIEYMTSYAMVELKDGSTRRLTVEERTDPDSNLPEGARIYRRMPLASQGESTTGRSDSFTWNGIIFPCPPGQHWSVSREGMSHLAKLGRLDWAGGSSSLAWKRYENEIPGRKINNIWHRQMSPSDMHYVVETAESVIERCILMATDPGDLVVDPTCGSGTTAFVSEKWGRRWITIDASAVPVALCRQRILSGVFDWYVTLDDPSAQTISHDSLSSEAKFGSTTASANTFDPRSGFVYERVPHVSAGTLAYKKEVKYTILVDRPVKKRGWKRVSAPFTVESHSPWRYQPITAGEDESQLRQEIRERALESLQTAGFPAAKGVRWHLDDIESWPGSEYVTHQAMIRETGSRAALCVLSDDQTATRGLVDRAAEDAAYRRAFKNLIICAFEYDSDAYSTIRQRRGRLGIIKLRANRDLAIAQLKPGEADRAFVMVGDPELGLRCTEDHWEVEVRGWNTYDPMTGRVRAGRAADIDCWLLDTSYDGRSFFARRIHFPRKSKDRQLKRFKRQLGRRLNPESWTSMESLVSAPFPRPETGRIAVRIITATGDEMLAERELPADS